MNNNWQILDMHSNLNDVMTRCGGRMLSAKKLSTMTALELIELLAPNDVRFCIKEKEKEQIEFPPSMELGCITLGMDLELKHQPSSARFLLKFGNDIKIPILYEEMKKLVEFAKCQN